MSRKNSTNCFKKNVLVNIILAEETHAKNLSIGLLSFVLVSQKHAGRQKCTTHHRSMSSIVILNSGQSDDGLSLRRWSKPKCNNRNESTAGLCSALLRRLVTVPVTFSSRWRSRRLPFFILLQVADVMFSKRRSHVTIYDLYLKGDRLVVVFNKSFSSAHHEKKIVLQKAKKSKDLDYQGA